MALKRVWRPPTILVAAVLLVLGAMPAAAQTSSPGPVTISCESGPGGRQVCPGDTSAGVAMMKETGAGACLLGKTWGYDDKGVWVAEGCSGEFQLGQPSTLAAPAPTSQTPAAAAPGQSAPATLTPEAKRKFLKGNYQRLFDEARLKVRAWEKAHGK